jgi:universal stress protein A
MLKLNRILCPTDFSEASLAGLVAACTVARECGAELILLHVAEPLVAFGELLSDGDADFDCGEAKGKLDRLVGTHVPPGVTALPMVKWGNAAETILQVALDEDVDLVVIATHGWSGWRHMLFGSVAEALVHGAHCPVLTVPSKKVQEELPEEEVAVPVPLV